MRLVLINGIELFKTVAPVEVVYITSNHDYHTMFGIANVIRKVYEKDTNVSVDYLPLVRKYKVFGKTLMGFAHDIDIKNINDLKLLQAGLIYDLNFRPSFILIKSRKYIESLKYSLPETKEITEIFSILKSYIDVRSAE